MNTLPQVLWRRSPLCWFPVSPTVVCGRFPSDPLSRSPGAERAPARERHLEMVRDSQANVFTSCSNDIMAAEVLPSVPAISVSTAVRAGSMEAAEAVRELRRVGVWDLQPQELACSVGSFLGRGRRILGLLRAPHPPGGREGSSLPSSARPLGAPRTQSLLLLEQ